MKSYTYKVIIGLSIISILALGSAYYKHVNEVDYKLSGNNSIPQKTPLESEAASNLPNTNSENSPKDSEDFKNIEPDALVVPNEETLQLTRNWDYKPADGTSKPIVINNQIIIKSPLSLIDNDTGKKIWSILHSPTDVIIVEDEIIFCEGNEVIAVDLKSGKEVWKFEMGEDTMSKPIAHQNNVYVTSGDGSIYGLALLTGEKVFEYILEEGTGPVGSISSPVIVGNFLFYISQNTSILYAIDIRSGTQVLNEPNVSSNNIIDITTFNNKIAWLTSDGVFSTIDINSKQQNSTVLLDLLDGEGIYRGFYENNGVLYMFSDKQITAIDENDEQIVLMFNIRSTDSSQERIADISVNDQSLWFATNKYLYSLELSDTHGKNPTKYSNQLISADTKRSIGSLKMESNELFISTSDSRLSKYLLQ